MSTPDMVNKFLRSNDRRKITVWLPKSELLEVCDYLLSQGFGVSGMEAIQAPGSKVARNFSYEILGLDGADAWGNHRDPARSVSLVREKLKMAEEDGADFLYQVWASKP